MSYNIFNEIEKQLSFKDRLRLKIIGFPVVLKLILSNIIDYNYMKTKNMFFFYFSIFNFTILRIDFNIFYSVYKIKILGINLLKYCNYEKFRSRITS